MFRRLSIIHSYQHHSMIFRVLGDSWKTLLHLRMLAIYMPVANMDS